MTSPPLGGGCENCADRRATLDAPSVLVASTADRRLSVGLTADVTARGPHVESAAAFTTPALRGRGDSGFFAGGGFDPNKRSIAETLRFLSVCCPLPPVVPTGL